jgi:hypothetical protein
MPSPTASLPPIPTESRCKSQPWQDFDTAGMTGLVCAVPWPATLNISSCCEGKWRLHDFSQICEVPYGFDFFGCVGKPGNLLNSSISGYVTGICKNASDTMAGVRRDYGSGSETGEGEWMSVAWWILGWACLCCCRLLTIHLAPKSPSTARGLYILFLLVSAVVFGMALRSQSTRGCVDTREKTIRSKIPYSARSRREVGVRLHPSHYYREPLRRVQSIIRERPVRSEPDFSRESASTKKEMVLSCSATRLDTAILDRRNILYPLPQRYFD